MGGLFLSSCLKMCSQKVPATSLWYCNWILCVNTATYVKQIHSICRLIAVSIMLFAAAVCLGGNWAAARFGSPGDMFILSAFQQRTKHVLNWQVKVFDL